MRVKEFNQIDSEHSAEELFYSIIIFCPPISEMQKGQCYSGEIYNAICSPDTLSAKTLPGNGNGDDNKMPLPVEFLALKLKTPKFLCSEINKTAIAKYRCSMSSSPLSPMTENLKFKTLLCWIKHKLPMFNIVCFFIIIVCIRSVYLLEC